VAAVSCVQLGGNLTVLARTLRKKRRETEEEAGFAKPALTLEAVNGWEALTQEAVSAWRDILSRNPSQTPFSDPDWLTQWWNAFGSGREPLFLVLREGGAIAGVLPLACSRRFGVKSVTVACRVEPAILPERTVEAARLILEYLEGLDGAVLCSFDGLTEESGFGRAVTARLAALGLPRSTYRAPYYTFETGGMTFDEFYRSRFSSGHIRSARKDEMRLALLGDVRFRELKAADMEDAFALHGKRWSRKLDTSGFCKAESRKFFTGLLETRGSSWRAQVLGLYLGSRLIAFQYGFLCADRYVGYTKAHDDLFGVFKPGDSILRECIRQSMETGVNMVELGLGYEEYKLSWVDEPQTVLSLAFSPANLPSRLLLCLRSVQDGARQRLKRNRRIVLFKRNTLGRIRYCLSPAHLGEALGRTTESLRRLGLRAYIFARLPGKKAVSRYPVKLGRAALGSLQPGRAGLMGPDDAEELALLYLRTPEQIMRRFYVRERCFAVKKGGRIACTAWAVEEKDRIVLRDFRRDRRTCSREDILSLLAEALAAVPKQKRGNVFLEIGQGDRTVSQTAEGSGLILGMWGSAPEKAPKAKEERIAET
jgi:CelD/BcsL family acetyltransferase involved in cellulose biosynthesis